MIIKKLESYYIGEQADLTRKLVEASVVYYGGETPIMSDIEFDREVEKLRKMEEASGYAYDLSPTQSVGALSALKPMADDEEFVVDEYGDTYVKGRIKKNLAKAKHEHPALSLDKVKYKDRENLVSWLRQSSSGGIMSWKLDGLTLVLTYDDGRLTSAVTRGNGEEGSVVTHNAKFFKGIPKNVAFTGHLVIRGEALMTNAEFERVNAEAGGIYENARNLAAATIQMLDANESRKREITFKAFELVVPEPNVGDKTEMSYMQDRLSWLESLGFDVVDHECVDSTDVLTKIEEWKEDLPNLPYPTDGLVFSYNDLYEGWNLGSTGHHPHWAMALKWSDETVTTTIRKVEWSVGKTGAITPVAVFDEVRLGLGSNVTRASLHNLSIMKRLSDQTGPGNMSTMIIGAKAEVYLANMIIPAVASIEVTDETEAIATPNRCPECDAETQIRYNNDVAVLHCVNPDCPAQQLGKLMNTFSKDGLFVKGLGESQIEDLLTERLVTADPLSFYTLRHRVEANVSGAGDRARDLRINGIGWGQKKWDNLLDAIDASRKTALQKFLYSLNIPLLGNDLSKKLAKYWGNDINAFVKFVEGVALPEGASNATDELCAIDSIGDEKAQNIVSWADRMTRKGGWNEVKALIGELNFPNISEANTDSSLAGLTFVITGNVHDYKNRDEFKASVEARGGKVAGSVSAKTTALVNNDVESTSGKNQKAKELGIEIISEDEFIARYGK